MRAIFLGAASQADMLACLPIVLEAMPNVAHDLHKTVIYSLEHP